MAAIDFSEFHELAEQFRGENLANISEASGRPTPNRRKASYRSGTPRLGTIIKSALHSDLRFINKLVIFVVLMKYAIWRC